jgi:hypothetical protein
MCLDLIDRIVPLWSGLNQDPVAANIHFAIHARRFCPERIIPITSANHPSQCTQIPWSAPHMPGPIGLHGIKMDGIILYASLRHCCSRLGSCGRRHNFNSYQSWLRNGWTYRWLATHTKSWQFLSVSFF